MWTAHAWHQHYTRTVYVINVIWGRSSEGWHVRRGVKKDYDYTAEPKLKFAKHATRVIIRSLALSQYCVLYRRARVLRQAGSAKEITDKARGPSSQPHWIMTSEARNHTNFFTRATRPNKWHGSKDIRTISRFWRHNPITAAAMNQEF